MAAEGMPFPWRWNGGTISTNLDVIWEMSALPPQLEAVWNLLLQAGSEGPTLITCTAPHTLSFVRLCVHDTHRAENSHQPFRRREGAMAKFRDMKTLQKFAAVHASIHNHFNQDRHLNRRDIFKQNRAAALAEWRESSQPPRLHRAIDLILTRGTRKAIEILNRLAM